VIQIQAIGLFVPKTFHFWCQNFSGKDPKIRCRNVYAPMGTHHVETFGAILPTDPDDI